MIMGIISCKSINLKNKTTMQLTPEINKVTEHLQKIEVFDGQNALDISRKHYETMAFQLGNKKEPVAMIEEFNIQQDNHQIPVRIYRPKGKHNSKSPAIVYIHGGWFIGGSYETHDAIVRKLANAAGAVILFVDYRLAPEHPFPAGLNDSIAATNWLIDNSEFVGIDATKIGVIGDSAGGALTAALSSQIGNKLLFQVLIYPAADVSLSTKSWETYADGPVLNKDWGIQAWNMYLSKPEDHNNPLAVPILIKDFKNIPSTFVLLAEHDPLLDEGQQLAENIKTAGIPVQIKRYKNMIHGFMHMENVFHEAQSSIKDIAEFTNNQFKITTER